jgi:hypothetical protein
MNIVSKMTISVCAASFGAWIVISAIHGYWCALSYVFFGKTEVELVASKCETAVGLLLARPLLSQEFRFNIAMVACDANLPNVFDLAAFGSNETISCLSDRTESLLHHCARVGCSECCVALVERGICSPNLVDAEGRKPVDVAKTTKIASYLLSFDFG